MAHFRQLNHSILTAEPAELMFLQVAEYTEFNSLGIPTRMRDSSGEADVPKSRAKKLQKEWNQRKRLNEKYAVQ